MIHSILSRLARVRFTVSYVATLAAVSVAILTLGPQVHERVIRHASTNLHNLARGHLGTLLNSAFVVDEGPLYFWLPCLACLLALAELQLRSLRLTVAFVVGHVGATLVIAAVLAASIELGWLPLSISRVSDVGMSYGALGVLGALTATIPRRWRPVWIAWWITVALATAVTGGDFTDAGHSIALMLGMVVTIRFGHSTRWTPVRFTLLIVSSGFGFLLLAHTQWTSLSGAILGALGAFAAYCFARPAPARTEPLPPDAITVPQRVRSV
ncbi:MAG: rhomboid-like protein [Mycobacterium sp.]